MASLGCQGGHVEADGSVVKRRRSQSRPRQFAIARLQPLQTMRVLPQHRIRQLPPGGAGASPAIRWHSTPPFLNSRRTRPGSDTRCRSPCEFARLERSALAPPRSTTAPKRHPPTMDSAPGAHRLKRGAQAVHMRASVREGDSGNEFSQLASPAADGPAHERVNSSPWYLLASK